MASAQAFGVDMIKKGTRDRQFRWDMGLMDMTSMLGKLKPHLLRWACHWIGRCAGPNDYAFGMDVIMCVVGSVNMSALQPAENTKQL